MAKKKDVIDCLEIYKSDKMKLTTSERASLIKDIVNTDSYITGLLLEVALKDDIELIINLTIELETDNVFDFISGFSILDNKDLDLLTDKLINSNRLAKRWVTSLISFISNELEIENIGYILGTTSLIDAIKRNTTKKNAKLIEDYLNKTK